MTRKFLSRRFPNDHPMFQEIVSIMKDRFTSTKDDGYISFVTDAINSVYHVSRIINNQQQSMTINNHYKP